ncbi:MAG: ethylbenzene dehydrogenase [Candidatus Lambdaproteobacteria bacterium]|nr:ethylbenzene dehydrogenase [Candidatus Lambdaproteobacteria bacterium]
MSRLSFFRIGRAALLALVLGVVATLAFGQKSLVSVKTDQAPAIDGAVDGAWAKAPEYKFTLDKTVYEPSNGYKGVKKTNVTMKSLYDAENIYFLVVYDDPTESLARYQWVKQGDGSWKQSKNADSTGHENTYYEDKAALLWNINTKDFDKRGCAIVCHKARGGKLAGFSDKSPGRKYTNKPGETVDMWHWKSVRTNPVGQIDDQYIDDTKDPAKNANWGRKVDAKTSGGYVDNQNKEKTAPAFMNAAADGSKFWVLDSAKAPFADSFKAGDVVGGIVIAPFAGSRGDIPAKGVWNAGKWTIELKRSLTTSGDKAQAQDVQFSDLKKTYTFGLSVFDNSAINHVYQEGVHRLTFK